MMPDVTQLRRQTIWSLIFPAASLLIALTFVAGLFPLSMSSDFSVWQIVMVFPFYLGVIAAPGYVYAWSGRYHPESAKQNIRQWVKSSLIAAVVASAWGLVVGAISVVLFPTTLGALIFSSMLLYRYRK